MDTCEEDICLAPEPAPARKVRHLELGPIRLPAVLPFALGLSDAVDSKESEVIVDIDSPGGSVDVGLSIINAMQAAHRGGMKLTCRVGDNAMAASMAAAILEAGCTTREMAPTAALLFHEPAVPEAGRGNEHDFRRLSDALADTNRRMAILIAPHLKHAGGSRWTADEYSAWIAGRDRWVDHAEAIAMGAVDG